MNSNIYCASDVIFQKITLTTWAPMAKKQYMNQVRRLHALILTVKKKPRRWMRLAKDSKLGDVCDPSYVLLIWPHKE